MSHTQGNFYSLDEEAPLARVTMTVEATYEEWSRLMELIFSDSRYRSGSGILIDRRKAPMPRANDVREIMQYVDRKEAMGTTRGWALVVPNVSSFGMGRMAQALSKNENALGVFRDIDGAVHWLTRRSGEAIQPRLPVFLDKGSRNLAPLPAAAILRDRNATLREEARKLMARYQYAVKTTFARHMECIERSEALLKGHRVVRRPSLIRPGSVPPWPVEPSAGVV